MTLPFVGERSVRHSSPRYTTGVGGKFNAQQIVRGDYCLTRA